MTLDLTKLVPVARPEIDTEGAQRRTYSDLELLAMPDPEWVIPGLVPAEGLIEVVGRYGAGKTFLFIDWLMHIAAGMPWQERPVTRGPCLYVYGEGAMKPRVAAWRTAHHVATEDTVGVDYVPGTVNLLDARDVTRFIAECSASEYAAIALDTLSRMAPGDENSPEYGAQVVASCDRIQRATGAAVILGHHTPWDPNTQRPKGNSKVPDCADAVFLLENADGALKLTCQKMRDAERPAPFHLKLTPHDGALVVDRGTPPASPAEELRAVLGAGPLTKKELQLRLGKSERTVDGLINAAGHTVAVVAGTGVRGTPARYMAVAV